MACEVRTAKELSDTSRHCSLKQQMLILELFHSSLTSTNSRTKRRSKSESDGNCKVNGEAGITPVDTVDETDSGGEEVVSSHEPSPLAQLSSVVIDSKIKVCVNLVAMLIAPHCMLISQCHTFSPISALKSPHYSAHTCLSPTSLLIHSLCP